MFLNILDHVSVLALPTVRFPITPAHWLSKFYVEGSFFMTLTSPKDLFNSLIECTTKLYTPLNSSLFVPPTVSFSSLVGL